MSHTKTTLRQHGFIKTALLWLISLGLLFTGSIMIWFVTLDIPSIDSFHTRQVAESTKIYDRTGEILLYDVHGNIQRTIVPLEGISRNIQNATVAIEDAEFYDHAGIRPLATLRAVFIQPLRGKGVQGGSTITQQTIKNTLLTNERTVTRKIKEWILSYKLEQQLPKNKILEIYLNETPYGGTLYGIEEASLQFFGKHASEVSLAEAAYLAALPQAPTYYSPYGNHREDLEERKRLVLEKMLENNFIDEEEYKEAREAEIEFLGNKDDENNGIKAPHFVFFIREYLEEKYGVDTVTEQGLRVVTTLDYELQQKAEKIVREHALENTKKFNAENAGLVAIDPKTGQILTMVGSRGYFDDEIDGKFNVTLAKRQPGSSFKPFVYAAAFAKGLTPDTVVFDVRTQFSALCAPDEFESDDENCYAPVNYDGKFLGPITLRNALAQSVNIPAVKVLYLVGIDSALAMAEKLGITTLTDPNRYGLTLVLGGGEVTLLDMVSSYSVFANAGVKHPHTGILRVETSDGEVLEEYEEKGDRVIPVNIARQISDILSDNRARSPAFGEFSYLYFPGYDVAAKTGTTNDYRDAWIIGYTPDIAIGSWAGNNNNTPMEKKVAGFIIAPMWNTFMQEVLKNSSPTVFKEPDQVSTSLPPILRGIWNSTGTTTAHSILYWINKNNPTQKIDTPASPNDPQFSLWEYAVSLWNGESVGTIPSGFTPNSNEREATLTPSPIQPRSSVFISHPSSNDSVSVGSLLTITMETGSSDINEVSYFINGIHIGSVTKSPFSLSFIPRKIGQTTIQATIKTSESSFSDSVTFTVE